MNERLAAKLRLSEKRIISGTMDAVRKRLAPIRGIPTKAGFQVGSNQPCPGLAGVLGLRDRVTGTVHAPPSGGHTVKVHERRAVCNRGRILVYVWRASPPVFERHPSLLWLQPDTAATACIAGCQL